MRLLIGCRSPRLRNNSMKVLCECGKICYTYREARQFINDAHRLNSIFNRFRKRIPKSCYKCEACHKWHISSSKSYIKQVEE